MKRKDGLLLLALILNSAIMSITTIVYPSPFGSIGPKKGYLFTFAQITDSQFSGSSAVFQRTISWLASHENISFVVHTGDIVNNPFDETAWKNAYEYMHRLDGGRWATLAGDNDVLHRNRVSLTNYEKYFGNNSSDQYFTVRGRLLFILFSWSNLDGSISPERLEWMDETIRNNENLFVVICLHPYLVGSFLNTLSPEIIAVPNSAEVWSYIDKHDKVIMTLSGHIHRNWVNVHVNGESKVWSICTEALSENGYIRLFDIYEDRIEVYGYSSWKDQSYTSTLDRFTIELNPNNYDVDGDLWGDNSDIMPTHPLVPNGVITSLSITVAFLAYWVKAGRTSRQRATTLIVFSPLPLRKPELKR